MGEGTKEGTKEVRYWIEEVESEFSLSLFDLGNVADWCDAADPTYLAGHAAAIFLSVDGKAERVGTFGILHPKVLQKFELPFPTSTLEINVEVFL